MNHWQKGLYSNLQKPNIINRGAKYKGREEKGEKREHFGDKLNKDGTLYQKISRAFGWNN